MTLLFKFIALLSLPIFAIISLSAHADDPFPYRGTYNDVPVIELSDLISEYDKVFIVDVRSQLEFDVVHIENAVNISISNQGFESKVQKQQAAGTKIITYCNGHTCKKSYKAARRLIKAGLENVYAFDAGIFDWIQANPEKSVLLGSQPADLSKLIPKSEYLAHVLDSDKFLSQAKNSDAMLIDVRDSFQRKGNILQGSRSVPVDRFHKWLIAGNGKDQTLYIADAVGKQVKWLQYYLNKYGYENYYFLKGGIATVE